MKLFPFVLRPSVNRRYVFEYNNTESECEAPDILAAIDWFLQLPADAVDVELEIASMPNYLTVWIGEEYFTVKDVTDIVSGFDGTLEMLMNEKEANDPDLQTMLREKEERLERERLEREERRLAKQATRQTQAAIDKLLALQADVEELAEPDFTE